MQTLIVYQWPIILVASLPVSFFGVTTLKQAWYSSRAYQKAIIDSYTIQKASDQIVLNQNHV